MTGSSATGQTPHFRLHPRPQSSVSCSLKSEELGKKAASDGECISAILLLRKSVHLEREQYWLVLGLALLLPLVVSGSKKGAHVSVKTSSDGEGREIPGEQRVV